MNDLLIQPVTKTHVAQYMRAPSQGLLLIGAQGSGKTFLATHIAAQLLDRSYETLQAYPYFTLLQPDEKRTISIAMIRELQQVMRLTTPGKAAIRRVVIIEHANAMTQEAQNAFLKLLEEPPADTVFLLTTSSSRAVLPTILSRTQHITVHQPDATMSNMYFAGQGHTQSAITQAYLLSGGLPGLMAAVLADDADHPLLHGVKTAKQLLGASLFDRLVEVDGLIKQKQEFIYVIEALQRIAQASIAQAAQKADVAKLQRWHKVLRASTAAANGMRYNVNTKLVADTLLFSL